MAEVLVFGGYDEDEPVRAVRKTVTREQLAELESPERLKEDLDATKEGKPTARSKAAVSMSLKGFSYQEIADTLGYASASIAQKAVVATIAVTYNPDDNKTLRMRNSARLEKLLSSVWVKANKDTDPEHIVYSRRATEIVADISKLHGLNAPAVLHLLNPDAEKIEEMAAHLLRLEQGEPEDEGDILELVQSDEGTFEEETDG